MKIEIDIPDETLAMVDRLAATSGVSRNEVINLVLEQVSLSVSFNDAMENLRQKQEVLKKLLTE